MLALKYFIPCYAAALCIKTHAALLTAWIEQNILLWLDSVPFNKNDETLVPEAGSCANCPKRTGFNTLLFDAGLQDSCTDKNCYNNKLTKNVERQIARNRSWCRLRTNGELPETAQCWDETNTLP